jgi:hypothetical protein
MTLYSKLEALLPGLVVSAPDIFNVTFTRSLTADEWEMASAIIQVQTIFDEPSLAETEKLTQLRQVGNTLLENGKIKAARYFDDSQEWQSRCLWYHVNALYRGERTAKGWDDNATPRALAYLSDPECPAWRRERIDAVTAWGDSAWRLYYEVKAQITSGQPWQLPSLPAECPYHFYQVLME